MSEEIIKMSYAVDGTSEMTMHSLPCNINSKDGQAACVEAYFESTIQPSTTPTTFESSLRGRPLKGARLIFPNDCKGVVLKKDADKSSLAIKSTFSFIQYWSLDSKPSFDENIPSTIKWLTVADSIHQKIDTKCYSD